MEPFNDTYMCVCVYVCVYIYIYIYKYVCVCVCVYIYSCMYMDAIRELFFYLGGILYLFQIQVIRK